MLTASNTTSVLRMLEGAETPVVKGTRLTSSWHKKNWWGESFCLPKWSKQIRSGCNPSLSYPLEQEFDDDAGEELELRQDKDEMEVITCKVGPSLLATLKPTRMPSIALFLNLSVILLFSKMCESCVDQQQQQQFTQLWNDLGLCYLQLAELF